MGSTSPTDLGLANPPRPTTFLTSFGSVVWVGGDKKGVGLGAANQSKLCVLPLNR